MASSKSDSSKGKRKRGSNSGSSNPGKERLSRKRKKSASKQTKGKLQISPPAIVIEAVVTAALLGVECAHEQEQRPRLVVERAPEQGQCPQLVEERVPEQEQRTQLVKEPAPEQEQEQRIQLVKEPAPEQELCSVLVEEPVVPVPPLLIIFRGREIFIHGMVMFCLCLLALVLSGVPSLLLLELYKFLSVGSALNIAVTQHQLFVMFYLLTLGAILPTILIFLPIGVLGSILSAPEFRLELTSDGIRQVPGRAFAGALRFACAFASKLQQTLGYSKIWSADEWDLALSDFLGRLPTQNPLAWEGIRRIDVGAFGSLPGVLRISTSLSNAPEKHKTVTLTLAGLPLKERHQLISRLRSSVPREQFSYARANRNGGIESSHRRRIKASGYTDLWFGGLLKLNRELQVDILPPQTKLQEGKIQVVQSLGGGGLSNVYLAQRTDEQAVTRPAVLKEFILSAFDDDDDDSANESRAGFENELTVLKKLKHPNIVQLIDSFTEDHRAYLVLEHIEGTSVQDHVEGAGPVPEEQVILWGLEMCAILRYLHTLPTAIVHRDFTPHNLIVKDNKELKVIDFNAALYGERKPNQKDDVVGKPNYISPEQFRGRATTQSDIYALGASLFFMLTAQEPEPISQSHPKNLKESVSQEMDRIVARATSLSVAGRYRDVDEMLADLLVAQQTQAPYQDKSLRDLVKAQGPLSEGKVIDLALQMSQIFQQLRCQSGKVYHQPILDNLFLQSDGSLRLTGLAVNVPVDIKDSNYNRTGPIYNIAENIYFLLTGIEPTGLRTANPQDIVSCSDEITSIIMRSKVYRPTPTVPRDDLYKDLDEMVADLLLAQERLQAGEGQ